MLFAGTSVGFVLHGHGGIEQGLGLTSFGLYIGGFEQGQSVALVNIIALLDHEGTDAARHFTAYAVLGHLGLALQHLYTVWLAETHNDHGGYDAEQDNGENYGYVDFFAHCKSGFGDVRKWVE